ncbi:MAG: copper chaperone PCu(A)C, partial [Chloroflexota bacterium]
LFVVPTAGAQMAEDVVITGVWARPTAGEMAMEDAEMMDMEMTGSETSAIYMMISNPGEDSLTLVAGETPVAGVVEIHETSMGENDVMQMRPVDGGIEIPAGESVELRPGGFHVMLLDMQMPLVPQDAFIITLTFEVEGTDPLNVPLAVPVLEEPPIMGEIVITQAWARPTAAGEMAMDDMGDMDMMATEEAMMDGMEMMSTEEAMMDGMEMDMDMSGTSAAYMFIENTGMEDVTLISGATDMAAIVEIHETSMNDNNVMQMRPLADGLVIPAGERVELRPGGFHVMFLDLQEPFLAGEALFLELTFDNGETLTVAAPIEDRLMMGMGE